MQRLTRVPSGWLRATCLTALAGLALSTAGPVKAQETIFGLTTTNGLFSFQTNSFGASPLGVNITPITGLGNQVLLGIDFRPTTGMLYGLSNAGQLFTINTATAAATPGPMLSAALSGANFGIDFNPVVDRLRVVSSAQQNLRIDVDTGATIVDGPLTNTNISYAAYTNNQAGAAETQLYDANYATNNLFLQFPPNEGTLVPVGPLGFNLAPEGDLDISGVTGTAYLASNSDFYTVNLGTGAATLVGTFENATVRGIAAPSVIPEPGTLTLLGTGILGLAGFARRRKQTV